MEEGHEGGGPPEGGYPPPMIPHHPGAMAGAPHGHLPPHMPPPMMGQQGGPHHLFQQHHHPPSPAARRRPPPAAGPPRPPPPPSPSSSSARSPAPTTSRTYSPSSSRSGPSPTWPSSGTGTWAPTGGAPSSRSGSEQPCDVPCRAGAVGRRGNARCAPHPPPRVRTRDCVGSARRARSSAVGAPRAHPRGGRRLWRGGETLTSARVVRLAGGDAPPWGVLAGGTSRGRGKRNVAGTRRRQGAIRAGPGNETRK